MNNLLVSFGSKINEMTVKRLMRQIDTTTAFLRDEGVICYKTSIFRRSDWEEITETLPKQLLEKDLAWFWMNYRDLETAKDSLVHNLPKERPLTRLEENNIKDLENDFKETDIDGNFRGILIFAVDQDKIDSF